MGAISTSNFNYDVIHCLGLVKMWDLPFLMMSKSPHLAITLNLHVTNPKP